MRCTRLIGNCVDEMIQQALIFVLLAYVIIPTRIEFDSEDLYGSVDLVTGGRSG